MMKQDTLHINARYPSTLLMKSQWWNRTPSTSLQDIPHVTNEIPMMKQDTLHITARYLSTLQHILTITIHPIFHITAGYPPTLLMIYQWYRRPSALLQKFTHVTVRYPPLGFMPAYFALAKTFFKTDANLRSAFLKAFGAMQKRYWQSKSRREKKSEMTLHFRYPKLRNRQSWNLTRITT